MIPPDPVRVRQVDADWCRWIAIATQHGYRNDFSAYAFNLLFLETGIDWRVILKPLRVVADGLGPLGRLLVDKVDS